MTSMLSERMPSWVRHLRSAAAMLVTEQVLHSQLILLHTNLGRCHQSVGLN